MELKPSYDGTLQTQVDDMRKHEAKSYLKVAVLACLILGLGQQGQAQQQDQLEEIRQEIETLKKDINTLAQQIQKIAARSEQGSNSVSVRQPDPPILNTVDIKGLPFLGNSDAPIVMIEYADFQCLFCMQYKKNVYPQILENYIKAGKVKYIWKDFPLQMHTRAIWAARASRCAGEQGKFWEMRDALFGFSGVFEDELVFKEATTLGIEPGKLADCLSSDKYTRDIQKSIDDAEKIGIDRTPTFVIGVMNSSNVLRVSNLVRGAYPYAVFEEDLNALLPPNQKHLQQPSPIQ